MKESMISEFYPPHDLRPFPLTGHGEATLRASLEPDCSRIGQHISQV